MNALHPAPGAKRPLRIFVVENHEDTRFLLCLLSRADSRYPKYPPQPVLRCAGYEPRRAADAGEADAAARIVPPAGPPAEEASE